MFHGSFFEGKNIMPKNRDSRVIQRSGRWFADFYDADGLRRRFAVDVPASATRRQADDAVTIWLAREHERQARHPWAESFDLVIARLAPLRHPETIAKYRDAVAHWRRYAGEKRLKYLDEIQPGHITELFADLALDHAPMGVNSLRSSLRTLFNTLHDWGYLPPGYSSRTWFRASRQRNELRERLYSQIELRALFDDPLYGDCYYLLYLTGARVGEIVALHASHIGEKTITYPHTKRGTTRTAPLSAETREFLESLPAARPGIAEGFILWRESWGDPADGADRRRARFALNWRLRRIIANHGWPAGRLHDIRATTATHLAPHVPQLILQKIMGWTNPVTAQRYYRQRPEDVEVPRLPAAKRRTGTGE
jgi:integrase